MMTELFFGNSIRPTVTYKFFHDSLFKKVVGVDLLCMKGFLYE